MTVPKHIGIILDGNRRYAKQQGKNSLYGHKKGADALEETIHACLDFGVQELTVYAFSTENFKRSSEEVDYLMKLIVDKSVEMVNKPELIEKEIAVKYIGDIETLPQKVQQTIADVEAKTADYTGFHLNFCVAYGGRSEITHACRKIAEEVKSGVLLPENIDETVITNHMYLQSEPDLIIRTSEQRLSNFLPWQGTYAEILFLPKLFWPEFNKKVLEECIEEYSLRKRRFGN
jgi:undecaprenyl diphosphate synthase